MKTNALQLTEAYVADNKQYINGNVSEHLIMDAQSAEFGYHWYITDEEIEELERGSSERKVEIKLEVENFIKNNFDFDISDF